MTELAWRTPGARWVLAATILGSSMSMLDATVVNIALPTLQADLGASLAGLQWTVNGYTLTLAAFILVAGSLGDRYGRRRVYLVGIVWFAAASLLCGLSQDVTQLAVARALQGVGGALLTPGSLAIIQASFRTDDRPRAIGAWSGLSGLATLVGPFLGGWLIDAASWRWIFLINVPIAAATVAITLRHVPESRDEATSGRFDLLGAVLAVVTLGAGTFALIGAADDPAAAPVLGTTALAVVGAVAFLVSQRRRAHPMVPLEIFGSRVFGAANLITFLIYGAMGAVFFVLVLELQVVAGYSATGAGLASLPITVLMLLLSARAGDLAGRIGPRVPMSLGPILCAAGTVLLLRVGPDAAYFTDVLPGILAFGAGLTLLVAPLTATVLGAVEDHFAGVASGVNNAVARTGSLVAVAGLPLLVGLSSDRGLSADALDAAFTTAMAGTAVLLAAGGLLAWLTVPTRVAPEVPAATQPEPGAPAGCAEPCQHGLPGVPVAPGAVGGTGGDSLSG